MRGDDSRQVTSLVFLMPQASRPPHYGNGWSRHWMVFFIFSKTENRCSLFLSPATSFRELRRYLAELRLQYERRIEADFECRCSGNTCVFQESLQFRSRENSFEWNDLKDSVQLNYLHDSVLLSGFNVPVFGFSLGLVA